MKQIICINPKSYNLTEGRQYSTRQEDDNASIYSILNDRGLVRNYDSSLFEDFVPEPVVRELTQEERMDSVNIDYVDTSDNGHIIRITWSTQEVDGVRNLLSRNWSYDIYSTNISCGIYQLAGIDNLIDIIRGDEMADSMSDSNRETVFKQVLELVPQHMESCAILLISTTVNGIDDNLENILDEMSDSVSSAIRNPNSGNNIKLWAIDVS